MLQKRHHFGDCRRMRRIPNLPPISLRHFELRVDGRAHLNRLIDQVTLDPVNGSSFCWVRPCWATTRSFSVQASNKSEVTVLRERQTREHRVPIPDFLPRAPDLSRQAWLGC